MENAYLRAETTIRLSEAMSLQTVSSALVEERSLDTILATIVDEASRVINARDILILLLEENGQWFRVSARKGRNVRGSLNKRLSVKDSLNGLVVKSGQPLVSQDAMTDDRANQERARLPFLTGQFQSRRHFSSPKWICFHSAHSLNFVQVANF